MRAVKHIALAALLSMFASESAMAQFGASSRTSAFERAISRNLERVFKPKLVIAKGATGPVAAMGISPDEHYLVTAVGDNTIRIWDLWLGRETVRLSGMGAAVSAIAMNPNQGSFVAVGRDGKLVVWSITDLANPLFLGSTRTPVTGITFLSDGNRIAVADAEGGVDVWSATERRVLHHLTAHSNGVIAVTASHNGDRLVTGGADGKVRVWNPSTGAMMTEKQMPAAVTALALSETDGLAVGLADGAIAVSESLDSPLSRNDLHDGPVTVLAFSKNGSGILSGGKDGTVRHLRAGTSTTVGKHDKSVTGVSMGADGTFALSVSEDGTTKLWNTKTRSPVLTLISTAKGWAVVDAKGRYDGNDAALSGLEWQAEDATANIDDFAETHYQAALLPRTLQQGDTIAEARTITDGVAYPPKVSLVSESGNGSTGKVAVEVVAEDNAGGGVSEIRLYRNGKLVSGNKAERRGGDQKRRVERYELEVGGGTTVITATAINNERLESRPQSVTVNASGPSDPGKIHLLTVGVNAYQDKSLNLYYAKPDAQAINDYFTTPSRIAAPLEQSVSLRDGQATRGAILAALRNLRGVPHDDLVVIYLAGHGVSVEDKWFFISHDANLSDESSDAARGLLSSDEMKAEIEALNADRILLLIDTCHSGTMVDPIKDYRGMKSLRLLARTVGTHVLAATDRTQSAIELERLGHGIFTYALLQGLSGQADYLTDGNVSATELVRFVEESVPALAKKYADDEQYPTGFSRGIDFSISKVVENPPKTDKGR